MYIAHPIPPTTADGSSNFFHFSHPYPRQTDRQTNKQTLTHGFSLFFLVIEDGELELCSHLTLVPGDKEQIERQVVPALLIQTLGIHSQTP